MTGKGAEMDGWVNVGTCHMVVLVTVLGVNPARKLE